MYGKAKSGRRKKQLTVFFQEDPVFEYNSFFTNLDVPDVEVLARRYAKRGNIENNIKAKNHVKARTSSVHLQYRLFLETISLVLANLWRYMTVTILSKEDEKPMTQDSFNHLLQKTLEAKYTEGM
jgi:IS4 transposase